MRVPHPRCRTRGIRWNEAPVRTEMRNCAGSLGSLSEYGQILPLVENNAAERD